MMDVLTGVNELAAAARVEDVIPLDACVESIHKGGSTEWHLVGGALWVCRLPRGLRSQFYKAGCPSILIAHY